MPAVRSGRYFVRAKTDAAGRAPPLAFAGLYETWTGPNGEELDTAAIVTTTANRTLTAIHDRMPVFVPQDAFDLWLDCANVEADVAAALIRPAADDLLEAYEISTAVNRVANDSEALLHPRRPLPTPAPSAGDDAQTGQAEKAESAGRSGIVVLSAPERPGPIACLISSDSEVGCGAMVAHRIVEQLLALASKMICGDHFRGHLFGAR